VACETATKDNMVKHFWLQIVSSIVEGKDGSKDGTCLPFLIRVCE